MGGDGEGGGTKRGGADTRKKGEERLGASGMYGYMGEACVGGHLRTERESMGSVKKNVERKRRDDGCQEEAVDGCCLRLGVPLAQMA